MKNLKLETFLVFSIFFAKKNEFSFSYQNMYVRMCPCITITSKWTISKKRDKW